jgi:hypothetical protein
MFYPSDYTSQGEINSKVADLPNNQCSKNYFARERNDKMKSGGHTKELRNIKTKIRNQNPKRLQKQEELYN